MQERARFIAPQRMGAWVVVAFGTAVVAFVVAMFGLREARLASVVSQVEVIKLNERIKALEQARTAPPVAAPAAAAPHN